MLKCSYKEKTVLKCVLQGKQTHLRTVQSRRGRLATHQSDLSMPDPPKTALSEPHEP